MTLQLWSMFSFCHSFFFFFISIFILSLFSLFFFLSFFSFTLSLRLSYRGALGLSLVSLMGKLAHAVRALRRPQSGWCPVKFQDVPRGCIWGLTSLLESLPSSNKHGRDVRNDVRTNESSPLRHFDQNANTVGLWNLRGLWGARMKSRLKSVLYVTVWKCIKVERMQGRRRIWFGWF